jgi:[protein-PII] uridylyltransferase
MSHLAQRRDLSDPRLIVEFARIVGDRTNLRNLYLLTFADIRASSPAGWTVWKGQLLQELFERTSEFLETGGQDPAKAIELIETRVEVRQEGARAELARLGVSREKIQEFFEDMPRRYFVSHTPRQIARHARVVLSYSRDKVLSMAVREMRGGFSEFLLCAKDVFGLFSNVAGVFTAKGINILGANVYTTRSGLALEVYRLSTPEGGEEERRETWAAVEKTLMAVLRGAADVDELVRRRRRPIGRMPSPSRKPPSVSISNSESDFYTIVDVSANDRQGLLHALTRTLREHGAEIYISKAATIMDQASDTFYVKDRQRKKLTRPARLEALREALLEAARGPEVEDG